MRRVMQSKKNKLKIIETIPTFHNETGYAVKIFQVQIKMRP
jgi:hypothetical protein